MYRRLGEMSKVVRARYEKGILKLLEPVELKEGEEFRVIIKVGGESIAKKFYGIAKKHGSDLKKK